MCFHMHKKNTQKCSPHKVIFMTWYHKWGWKFQRPVSMWNKCGLMKQVGSKKLGIHQAIAEISWSFWKPLLKSKRAKQDNELKPRWFQLLQNAAGFNFSQIHRESETAEKPECNPDSKGESNTKRLFLWMSNQYCRWSKSYEAREVGTLSHDLWGFKQSAAG